VRRLRAGHRHAGQRLCPRLGAFRTKAAFSPASCLGRRRDGLQFASRKPRTRNSRRPTNARTGPTGR
jgi:hypothetical protein